MSRAKYHPLTVLDVLEETADARSIVFEIAPELQETFRYKPGQFLTLHVPCAEKPLPRCYSASSSPHIKEHLRVTVKRVSGGRSSNWLCASLKKGDTLQVSPPAGIFTPRSLDSDLLMYAGGSGITPVFSILRSVLTAGKGRVRLVYANRDERSVIFAQELAQLSREHPQRLQVIHWLDGVQGFATQPQLAEFARGWEQAECFICGPSVFMDASTAALEDIGIPHARVHVERFVSLPEDADDAAPQVFADGPLTQIEALLDGTLHRVEGRPGELLLDSLERAGVAAPYSCRAGACAACMCHLEEGDIELIHNHVLTPGDMEQGWVLACQAVPTSPKVRVKYPG